MERASNLRSKIDFNTIKNIRSFVCNYDEEIDSLIMQTKTSMPCVSVDWDGDLWVRINPHTGEIWGVEIEGFKEFFSKKYCTVLEGRTVTNPLVKELIIAILEEGSEQFTEKDFTTDLERVCRRIKV